MLRVVTRALGGEARGQEWGEIARRMFRARTQRHGLLPPSLHHHDEPSCKMLGGLSTNPTQSLLSRSIPSASTPSNNKNFAAVLHRLTLFVEFVS